MNEDADQEELMNSKKQTFNEKVIELIKNNCLTRFSVLQLRDLYLEAEPSVDADQAYRSIYKAIWLMRGLGIFEKAENSDKSSTYIFTADANNIIETQLSSKKGRYRGGNSAVHSTNKPSNSVNADAFVQQMLKDLPMLESEMLAKRIEALEYQHFLKLLPDHKDMLVTKFNEANAEGIKLLGKITAIQRVLSELR